MRKRFPSAVAGLLLWIAASTAYSVEPFSKGPYIQFPAPGTATIIWEGPTRASATVWLGTGQAFSRKVEGIQPEENESQTTPSKSSGPTNVTYFLYKANFHGLTPGALYSYRVEFGGAQSPTLQFRTLDPAADHTQFIVYGDSRSDPKIHAAVARQFLPYAPDFILHSGDLVARGRDYSLWSREFFTPAGEVIARVPFFSVIGNHEQDGTNYLNYFDLPGSQLWYSFDSGPVHVLALDYRFEKRDHEQFRFAEQDLRASRAPWKLVILHTPVFNIGGHASAWGHQDFLPLFHQAKVDLVLSGHSHLYERFRPLAPKRSQKKWVITHITTGGGGANLHTALTHPALLQQETTNHFMVFDVGLDTLRAQAIRVDGSLIDSFELRKSSGRIPAAYRSQTYPEESLNLFFETAPMLAARVAAVPTPTNDTRLQFKIPARKSLPSPLELEILLTPESAKYYELPEGPLRIASPSKGGTNILTTTVRATGAAKISTTSSAELAPPLAFQAKVKSREGSTLSYGAKARVGKLQASAVNQQ